MPFEDMVFVAALFGFIALAGYLIYKFTHKQFRLFAAAAVLILLALVIRVTPLHGLDPINIKLSFNALASLLLVVGVAIALAVSFFYIRGKNASQQTPTTPSPKKKTPAKVSSTTSTAQPAVAPAQPAPVTPAQPAAVPSTTTTTVTTSVGQPTP